MNFSAASDGFTSLQFNLNNFFGQKPAPDNDTRKAPRSLRRSSGPTDRQ
jgi:hypothetical protein